MPTNVDILAVSLLIDCLTVDHVIGHIVGVSLGLTHGVIHSGALLLPLLRAVGADGGLANLNLVILCHVLVVDGASLLELLVTFLLLVGLKVRDVGGVASLLGLVDAGHHLRVVGVGCHHHPLLAGPALLIHYRLFCLVCFTSKFLDVSKVLSSKVFILIDLILKDLGYEVNVLKKLRSIGVIIPDLDCLDNFVSGVCLGVRMGGDQAGGEQSGDDCG